MHSVWLLKEILNQELHLTEIHSDLQAHKPTSLFCLQVASCITGQGKSFEIQLPSRPVNFSFQSSPLKYYLPNRHAKFMPYQRVAMGLCVTRDER